MGRAPCCSKVGLHRGKWTPKEDALLARYIRAHGEGRWRTLPRKAGLLRCGKSCRLRWKNYLRPDIEKGDMTPDEDDLIIRMHTLLGNRWSVIARMLPGRTDNQIKNYWNTCLSKKLRTQGTKAATTINKKQNENSKQYISEPKKLKVYKPKPLRLISLSSLPIIDGFEWNTISTAISCSRKQKVGCGIERIEEVILDAPYDQNGVCFFVEDDNFNKQLDFDVCQSHALVTNNNNLEKLREDFLDSLLSTDYNHELFELDSFAQSLLL